MTDQENTSKSYNPNHLLDALKERMTLRNDAALCRRLKISAPNISKIRHGRIPVGSPLLIRMHEEFDLSIRELRELMGDRRQKFRASDAFTKKRPEAH